MKGDKRCEVAKLGLGVNVKVVHMNEESVGLSWLWSVRVRRVCGFRDYGMEVCNGQI